VFSFLHFVEVNFKGTISPRFNITLNAKRQGWNQRRLKNKGCVFVLKLNTPL